ncbi:lovastatin nonaketide synthase [Aspergillus pseudotamarii]|uniref:Lovastatin nonaketide synthase n=1 Tax=Aspergillus pseudotamarii TaxID=132259 RepID=A0A5N6SG71_ASPPS|nr:lovastatin nonaketide synthase [Aspergillus pseudotamarii]KAE8133672.1 lovastatin nonaketide synthase [Aspergillus pseudotamarii]
MNTSSSEPIAIVGSGCRFPGGSSSPARLWELLRAPRDVSSDIPEDRFSWKGFYHPDGSHHGTTNTKQAYFIEDGIRKFDAQFFNIPPAEADAIDPQQRLLLETVYEAIESAGMTLEDMQGTETAVFVGMMGCDYADVVLGDLECAPTYTGTGTARSIHSNRVSYFFDWHGPSMTIDTACSSSMMAIYLAVQALRNDDAPVAIAAGASLIIGPDNYVILSNLNMLAPDGRAKMWDAGANGYARGEGVGVVVLKRLSAALRDGDPIECIIREVCVNQDGRTQGITMPNELAQAALIRRTYERAGLDPNSPRDRPQYFEAHGTGTPAGDPKEAEAIAKAFFGVNDGSTDPNPMYVGSVKTVIGHTEGAAGIAGILKTSLALQHGLIAPNLLFDTLSPAVAVFTKQLRVPTSLIAWPAVPGGGPRRASVNSFGFGGSNGHAILESFVPVSQVAESDDPGEVSFSPFTFSAPSERALISTLTAFAEHLQNTPKLNMRDLAYTLQTRRSAFPFRTTFWAATTAQLVDKINERLQMSNSKETTPLSIRALSRPSGRVLGIFTGQGAQWVGMGMELVQRSSYARSIVVELQQSLEDLPEEDRPAWSLTEQLAAGSETSRLGEAAIAQPLCTAIQIMLVRLLRHAGIEFAAVVGHSSGEIAAAYAAGFLTSGQAIRIAYYRGLWAKLAKGPNEERGAMLAVGTSLERAEQLCSHPDFKGRITVAASNSPASVTLSGDKDAIDVAKLRLDEDKVFVRMLRVDTAYHSHHMIPSAQSYVQSLLSSGIQPIIPDESCPQWYSSVSPGQEPVQMTAAPGADYWAKNMVQTVLFAQAVKNAVSNAGPFDIAIEIGPHPALRGPFSQTAEASSEDPIPYSGCLMRGVGDIEAFANALGLVWSHIPPSTVTFDAFERIIAPHSASRTFIRGLPSYPWDHGRSYWFESRISSAHRYRKRAVHPLLGVEQENTTESEIKWRNFLRTKEIPWLKDHRIQGQPVFPAAGYTCMAWEAAMEISDDRPVQLFEIHNLEIGQAILFDENPIGMEIIFAVNDIQKVPEIPDTLHAKFTCHSCSSRDSNQLFLNAKGDLTITYGNPSFNALPASPFRPPNVIDTDPEEFYSSLSHLGYGYTKEFKSIVFLERKRNYSYGFFRMSPSDMIIHPATVDTAFQALLAAMSYPGDGALWSLHMPVSVRHVRLNPYVASLLSTKGLGDLVFEGTLVDRDSVQNEGNVQIYPRDMSNALLQLEGVRAKPFTPATSADDRKVFSKTIFDLLVLDGASITEGHRASAQEYELATLLERVAHFYLRRLHHSINQHDKDGAQFHHRCLLTFCEHIVNQVSSGQHPWAKPDWAKDTKEDILTVAEKYAHLIDLRIMHSVGENLISVVRGETTILQHLAKDNMLEEYYRYSLGFPVLNGWLARMVKQLVHRFPRMKILEIGAGTGGATKEILQSVGLKFTSYTYTDISPAFFDRAQDEFKEFSSKMEYRTLDIELDFTAQGYVEHSFDLVIASNVIHATKSLEESLRQVRGLLRPGGHLMLLEITDARPMRYGFLMGGLPGWWVGHNDGRKLGPTIKTVQWDEVLHKAGFSGVDALTPSVDPLPYPLSVMATQAVDQRITFLREPIFNLPPTEQFGDLLVVGGRSLQTSKLVRKICNVLSSKFRRIHSVGRLDTVDHVGLPVPTNIIYLGDLDEPTFNPATEPKFKGLKSLINAANNIVWVTSGCQGQEPYNNMSIGFGRSLIHEVPGMHLQFLNALALAEVDGLYVAELLLKLCALQTWAQQGQLEDLAWTSEPEIYLQDGKEYIPRVVHDLGRNNRYNSRRRPITKKVNSLLSPVELQIRGESYILSGGSHKPSIFQAVENLVTVTVVRSISAAVNVHLCGPIFVAYGMIQGTLEPVVLYTESNSSIVRAPQHQVFPCRFDTAWQGQLLEAVVWQLIADHILLQVPSRGTVLLYQPPKSLLSVLHLRVINLKVQIIELVNTPATSSEQIFVHPRTMEHHIVDALPRDLTVFADFSTGGIPVLFGRQVQACVPDRCAIIRWSDIFCSEVSTSAQTNADVLHSLFEKAMANAAELLSSGTRIYRMESVAPDGCSHQGVQNSYLKVVDWETNRDVMVPIETASAQTTFNSNKTYLLIGLTGDLGQSLCEWMIAHGARTIVLVSRKPRIAQEWLEMQSTKAAQVHVYSVDVTKRRSINELYQKLIRELPPVAGVVNAAMVLQDSLFSNTSVDMLKAVLMPKVDGSRHLSELFQDPGLDFFILFSSLSVVGGNSGQSSYTAANAYLTALADQRRSQGLPASVMDLGPVLGLGYITRAGQLTSDDIHAYGAYPISEQDFLEHFAEAVLASPVIHGANYEIISGIREVDPVVDDRVSWIHNPRLSHLLADRGRITAGPEERIRISVKEQLLDANTTQEAREMIQDAFTARLLVLLQLPAEGLDNQVPLIELGLDSLVAVEVRSWFMKNINVDIPVLKVLGGSTIPDIVDLALQQLPQDTIPKQARDEKVVMVTTPRRPETEEVSISSSTDTSAPMLTASATSDDYTEPSTSDNEDNSRFTPTSSPSAGDAACITELSLERQERMSFAQSRFWFVRHHLQDPTTFNITFCHRLEGNPHIEEMAQAFITLGVHHKGLRTCFFEGGPDGNQPMQGVMKESRLRLELRHITTGEEVNTEFSRLKHHVYDLESGDTMRAVLLTIDPQVHYLIVGYHHIAMDGVGFAGFLQELLQLQGQRRPPPIQHQYIYYSERQHEAYESGQMAHELEYWRKELANPPQPLPILPFAKTKFRRPLKAYQHYVSTFRLNPVLTARIKRRCRNFHVTSFHFYLTVLQTMLFRLLEMDDLCIGIAESNRTDKDLLRTMGVLVNPLAVRFSRDMDQSFGDAVRVTRGKAYSALEHATLPFDVLLTDLHIPRSAEYSPLFQVFFDFRTGVQERLVLGDCQVQRTHWDYGRTGYDINLDVMENTDGDAVVSLSVQKSLYSQEDADLLGRAFQNLVANFATSPAQRLPEGSLFANEDIEKAITIGSGHYIQFNWPNSISECINHHVAVVPDSISIQDDGNKNGITYRALGNRSNHITLFLRGLELPAGSRVSVIQEPGVDHICSMLATFQLGMVYVPVDLRQPLSRLRELLDDCQPSVILCHKATAELAESLSSEKTSIVNVSDISSSQDMKPASPVDPSLPAMILYTSGSTGKPKGIILSQATLCQHLEGMAKTLGLGKETILQQSAPTFDLAISQTLMALCTGCTLIVVPQSKRGDAFQITQLMVQEGITFTFATPSEYASWLRHGHEQLQYLKTWKFALSGGEILTPRLVDEFNSLCGCTPQIINVYGPAEITIASHCISVQNSSHDEVLSVGKPLPNYTTYIMDENMKPLPIGYPGEIYIGGCGVSIGYLNHAQLTHSKYIADPFISEEHSSRGWTRFHRTGDRGRLASDGSLHFEGRIGSDTIVKLRGIRIELEDIESTIVQQAKGIIEQAVVSVRGNPEFLIAHVVFSRERADLDRNYFLKGLQSSLALPQYMRPALIIELEQLPVNAHFKTDRSAVAELELPSINRIADTDQSQLLTDAEKALKGVWDEVLPIELINMIDAQPDQTFFEAGGNSLLLIKLQDLVRRRFSAVLSLEELYEASTLKLMAQRIENAHQDAKIDWGQETSTSTLTLVSIPTRTCKPRDNGAVVILTGATGSLGSRLLAQLMGDSRVSQIRCVAVRRQFESPGEPGKVSYYAGDLSKQYLGLPKNVFEQLSGEADVILHVGADRSFWDRYQAMRGPNVNSTRALVALAAPRRVRIHYISSGGVFSTHQGDMKDFPTPFPVPCSQLPPNDGSNGYLATKWASEKILENAAEQLSIPVTIHRPLHVAPKTMSDEHEEALAELRAINKKHNITIKSSNIRGHMDLVKADEVASNIVTTMFAPAGLTAPMDSAAAQLATNERYPVSYVHHQSSVRLTVEDLASIWEQSLGEKEGAKFLSGPEWIGFAKRVGFSYIVASQNFQIESGADEAPLVSQR